MNDCQVNKRIQSVELYLDTTTFEIHDEFGHQYSAGEAEQLVDSGVVVNTNLAMYRLIGEQYEMEAVKEYYAWADRYYG